MLGSLSAFSLGMHVQPSVRSPVRAARIRGGAPNMADAGVEGFLNGMCNDAIAVAQTGDAAKIDAYFSKYCTPDCEYIRPSGNPMDVATYKGMLLSNDIKWLSDELVSVDMVKFLAGGDVGVVAYRTRQKFDYKGTMNDDVAKFTAVLDKTADGWKAAHVHRSTGMAKE